MIWVGEAGNDKLQQQIAKGHGKERGCVNQNGANSGTRNVHDHRLQHWWSEMYERRVRHGATGDAATARVETCRIMGKKHTHTHTRGKHRIYSNSDFVYSCMYPSPQVCFFVCPYLIPFVSSPSHSLDPALCYFSARLHIFCSLCCHLVAQGSLFQLISKVNSTAQGSAPCRARGLCSHLRINPKFLWTQQLIPSTQATVQPI